MRPDDIQLELRRKPFQPFRLHLSDGTQYEIRHPDLVMTGLTKLLIGTPQSRRPEFFDRYDVVNLLHVTRLEPLESLSSSQNGSSPSVA